MAKGMGKQSKKTRLGFLGGALVAAAIGVVLLSQQHKLDAIAAERQALDEEYAALEIEKQRIEYMIEYAQSEEYRLQYAREKLGYVKPGDIKFSVE